MSALSKAERLVILTAALVLCLALDERIFVLVAAGATYRLFTKDLPAQPSRATAAYFLAVLASLGLMLWLIPAQASPSSRISPCRPHLRACYTLKPVPCLCRLCGWP
jgi:hypothetical protein